MLTVQVIIMVIFVLFGFVSICSSESITSEITPSILFPLGTMNRDFSSCQGLATRRHDVKFAPYGLMIEPHATATSDP